MSNPGEFFHEDNLENLTVTFLPPLSPPPCSLMSIVQDQTPQTSATAIESVGLDHLPSSSLVRSSASYTKRQRISDCDYLNTKNAESITADTKKKVAGIEQKNIVILDKDILNAFVKEEFNDLLQGWSSRGRKEDDRDTLSRIKGLMVLIGEQARSIPPSEYKDYPLVPHLCTILSKKYCDNVTVKTGEEKVYYGKTLKDDAYKGLNFKDYDCLGCTSCENSVANGLCTSCWTASRCVKCIKQLGCETCQASDSFSPIAFKKPTVGQASNIRNPKYINNNDVLGAFINALPDNTTWLEAIGSGQINLEGGVSVYINLISRGFNKGRRYDDAVAVIKDTCNENGWAQEALSIDAHENLARAHYLTKCIPRFRSKWGTKTLICPFCRNKFVNGVRMVANKFVAERCQDCAEKKGKDTCLYSPGYDENGTQKYILFKGRSYFTSVKIHSFV